MFGFRFKIILADPGAVLCCTLAKCELNADGKKEEENELSHGYSVNFNSLNKTGRGQFALCGQFRSKSANRGGFFYE